MRNSALVSDEAAGVLSLVFLVNLADEAFGWDANDDVHAFTSEKEASEVTLEEESRLLRNDTADKPGAVGGGKKGVASTEPTLVAIVEGFVRG